MKLIGLKIFLLFFVILDVVAFPISCSDPDPDIQCYFYLEDIVESPYIDPSLVYQTITKKVDDTITESEILTPSKEGYVFIGWESFETKELVEFDIVVHKTYYQGNRNLMIFIARWEEESTT